jgi:RNA polymerase sigma factor (sigma-70 family)
VTHTVVKILGRGDIAELTRADRTDGQLLDLFVCHRDAEAFAAVVRRHGPMVLGVCRRVLRNHADADDAFQAAFLVLARKAARIGTRELLAQWLYGVAFNTARKLREANARRAVRERPLAELPEPPAAGGSDCHAELAAILDEELSRLPERYRVPIVLCDLEGATRREAARLLGWPEGTVAGRLARARAMLAERLAGRGVVMPVVLLVAILAERQATACGPELLRAVATGEVAPRIAETTERVIHAMFVKQLKTIGLAALACGLVLAGAFGAFTLPATAQPAPPTDPTAKPPAPPKPAAKAGPKIATVIPLKKSDAARIAAVVIDTYKGIPGVTVGWHNGDKALLVYAGEQTTTEIEGLIQRLGEDQPRKLSVLRLKAGTDAPALAKKLAKDYPEATVIPVAGESALLVYGTHLDTKRLRVIDIAGNVLGEEKPAAEPKKYTVQLKQVPWAEVLDWYAEVTGLTPIYSVKPKGNVTLMPPKDRQFTVGEITDLLNEAMMQQKCIIVRGEKTFTVLPSDEAINPMYIPRLPLSEVRDRGKTELVETMIPLETLDMAELKPEVQKMLTPFGEVTFAKGKHLVIRDTAGNVNRIADTIQVVEQANRKTPPAPATPKEPTDPKKRDPRSAPTPADPADRPPGSVFRWPPSPPKELPKGSNPLLKPLDPELRKYLVPTGTGEEIAKKLEAAHAGMRVFALPTGQPNGDEIIVQATPPEHAKILTEIKEIVEGKKPEENKPEAPPPAPKSKKITFEMKNVQWETVLDWFSKESGLTPIYSVKPTGKFTHIPPTPETQYTLEEIIDILNEGMASQKFMLVRRQVSFTILPTDEKLDYGPIPRTELSDLPNRGKRELVQVLIPLKTLDAEEAATEVQKMLTPFGAVSVLTKMNMLVVVDSAGNVKRIADMIAKVDVPGPDSELLTHQCKYVKATEIADQLKTLLAEKDTEKRPLKAVVITVNEKTNSVTIAAPQDKIALAKKIIDARDKPAKPGDPPITLPEPEIRKYPVPGGTAEATAKTLQADMPGIRVIALPTGNEIIVMATPDEHFKLLAKLKLAVGNGPAIETVAIPLTIWDPAELAPKLRQLFPSEDQRGARIEPRGGEKPAIVVKGTPEQIKEIRKTIELLEGPRTKKLP